MTDLAIVMIDLVVVTIDLGGSDDRPSLTPAYNYLAQSLSRQVK